MNASLHRRLNRRKRRILRRLENQPGVERHQPMLAATNMGCQPQVCENLSFAVQGQFFGSFSGMPTASFGSKNTDPLDSIRRA